jgi:hypothetical protein
MPSSRREYNAHRELIERAVLLLVLARAPTAVAEVLDAADRGQSGRLVKVP